MPCAGARRQFKFHVLVRGVIQVPCAGARRNSLVRGVIHGTRGAVHSGAQHASLPYLPKLTANGVQLAQVPHSGHWPMYSNPTWMWDRIATLHARTGS